MEPFILVLKGKRLFCKDEDTISPVGDNSDYIIKFEGVSKTAVFAVFNRDGKTQKISLDENKEVLIPMWVLKKGSFEVGLYSDGFASTAVSVYVRASVMEDDYEQTEDVPQSMVDQLIELVNKDIASVEETKTQAVAAKNAAETANEEVETALESITAKDGYLNQIKGYAEAAKSDATSAAENAEKIQGAVSAANEALAEAKELGQVANEIIGEGGTFENPKDNTALKQIRDIKEAVTTAKNEAQAAQAAAETAQSGAQTAKSEAQAAQAAAETAQSGAQTAQAKAEEAQAAAETAQTGAQTAKNEAQASQAAAETAKAEAQEYAEQAYQTVFGDSITTALAGKVDKEEGKVLSSNDFTDALKTKLDGVAEGANKTVTDNELSSTSTNPIENRTVTVALSGKAGATHSHGISEVTNLQTTLDGKASSAHGHSLDEISETDSKKILTSQERTKLTGIAEGANNYVHPTTHPASMIEEDETHRFTSDTEKSSWNNKVDKVSGKGLSTNDFTTNEKNSLADIITRLAGLKFVVSSAAPTSADENTITIVVPN